METSDAHLAVIPLLVLSLFCTPMSVSTARVSKPGLCPIFPDLANCNGTRDSCRGDYDCIRAEKCCRVGCKKICLDPAEAQTFLSGDKICPVLPRPSRCTATQNECLVDPDCTSPRMCCSDGCSYKCVKPVIIPTPTPREWKTCRTVVDLAFLVDSSGSITRTNYKKLKAFIIYTIRSFGISHKGSHAAIILYSDSASLKAGFNAFYNTDNFIQLVRKLPHERGKTRIDKALILAAELFRGARRNVPRIAMVLTDGEQTKSPDAIHLRDASAPLREAGVRVLAYGIAKKVNKHELRLIVERDQDVIHVSSFDGLIKNTKTLTNSICQASSTEPVHQDADIIFLIDSSTDVTLPQYESQQNFVRGLTRQFIISPLGPRAALMTYSARTQTVIEFSEFTNVPDFSVKINDSPFLGGQRRIDLALEGAARMFMEKSRTGNRILVLLTAGNVYTGAGARNISVAMQSLMRMGARVYVLGIGSRFNSTSYELMVRAPEDIFIVPSFDSLSSFQRDVAKQIRLRTTATGQEPSRFSADVVFLMDSSDEVNQQNYNIEKNYVKLMAKLLNLGTKGTRAAVYVYSYYTKLINSFGYDEYQAFASDVNQAPHLGGSRRIHVAFEAATEMLRSSRSNAAKLVVLITAGASAREPSAKALSVLAKALRDLGGKVFVIGIRPGFDAREFLSAVETGADIFPVTSYDGMLPAAPPMVRHMMASWGLGGTPHNSRFQADIVFVMDASQTLNLGQYIEEKEHVKLLYRVLSGQYGQSRAGLIAYGYNQLILLRLGDYTNLPGFETTTDRAPYLGGAPKVDHALSTAGTLFEEARANVPWIVVLLTTGKQTPGTKDWKEAMEPLHNRGVWPYVVTIGGHVTPAELGAALVERSDVFAATSFRDLPALVGPMAKHIIGDKFIYGPSDYKLDVVFLLDSSSDVSSLDFKAQTDYVKRLPWHLGIMQGDSRGALISYGDVPDIVLTFNDHKNASEILTSLDKSSIVGGERRIDRALETATVVSLKCRSRIPKAVILFTAGKPVDNRTLETAIAPLRKLGIWIFVVAVGSESEAHELREVTLNAEDIFHVKSFDELSSTIGPVARHVMNTTVSSPPTFMGADIVFIVDASKGMPFDQYKDEKDFILLLARYLNIDADNTRVALVVYGFRPLVQFGFEDNNGDFDKFASSLDRAPYIGGQRRTERAVEAGMAELFLKARISAPKIAVLLTAGKPSGDVSLESALRPLHSSGVMTYVVYTGSDMTDKEVQSAVDKPQDAFIVQSYTNLHRQAIPVARHVNFDSALLAPPSFASDVVFLLDSSQNVSFAEFYIEKNFVRFLGRYVRISPKHSRAGLVSYGDRPSILTNIGAYNTTGEFYRSVAKADYVGGSRQLDRVLESAAAMFLSARPAVPKVLILFTAGDKRKDSEAEAIDGALKRLNSIGVKLYVISVGKRDTRVKVVKPSDMFEVPSYRNLPTLVVRLAMHMFTDTASLGPPDFKADIVFMVDTSAGVSPQNYRLEKNFVKLIARHLNVCPGKSHASFIVYNTNPAVVSPLNKFTSTWDFMSAVDRTPHLGGGRRIDRVLRSAATQLESARLSSRKVAILVKAGNQLGDREIEALEESVLQLRNVGVLTYVVTIGTEADVDHLSRIVHKPEDVFQVESYQLLPLRVEPVARHITSHKEVSRYPTDIVFIVDASENSAGKYKAEKEFVKSMATYLNADGITSRASLIIFNETSVVVVKFTDSTSTGEFLDAVDKAPFLGGSRRTRVALEAAVTLFLESRFSVSRVAFLVTVDTATDGADAALGESVQNLRSLGVRTYVSVLGTEAGLSAYRSVVENSKDLFLVDPFVSSERFDSINQVGSHVARGTPKPLNLTMQLVFMLDSSDESTSQDYEEQKNFIKKIVRTLNVYPGGSEIGIMAYSDEPSIIVKLRGGQTLKSFDEAVDSLPHLSGTKRIDKAVEAVGNLLKGANNSPDKKFVIMLTKGSQENEPDAKTLLNRYGAKTHVIVFGAMNDSTDEPGSISVRSSLDLDNYVDLISRRVLAAYVAPRSVEVSICPGYFEVKCATVASNDCYSDSDCANSNQMCCFDGCKNVCYEYSSVTPRVTGQFTSPTIPDQTTHIPTAGPNTPAPTTTTHTAVTTKLALTSDKVTAIHPQTTSSENEPASTLPTSTNEEMTSIATTGPNMPTPSTTQTPGHTSDKVTTHPHTSSSENEPSTLPTSAKEETTTMPTGTTHTRGHTSDKITTYPQTTSSKNDPSTPPKSSNEQMTPISTRPNTPAPSTAQTSGHTSDKITTHPQTTSSRTEPSTPSTLTDGFIDEATTEAVAEKSTKMDGTTNGQQVITKTTEATPPAEGRTQSTMEKTVAQTATLPVTTATTQFITETVEPTTLSGRGSRKPGICPRIGYKDMQCPSKSQCQNDRQCRGQLRCCYHTCRRTVCVKPASKEEEDAIRRRLYRPGKCPIISRPSLCPQNPVRECNYDVDCRGRPDLKCCDNGCYRRCIAPVLVPRTTSLPTEVRSGKCPPYSPNQRCPNLVQDDCTCDSDCGENDKCCFDGCRRLCRKTAGKICAASVDIIYLMDSSASIGPYEYELEKGFVKDLARIFQIGASRAGLVIYSDEPKVMVKFDEQNDMESFAKAVDEIPFLANRTRIDKALGAVSKLFLKARKGVPKILIVLTDGRQTKDPDTVLLFEASQPLRDQAVKTYAVGVGHHIDKDELRAMVDQPSDVFYVGSFQDLIRQSQTIAEEACKGAERLCTKSVDVGFLVDASESISKEDFQKQKEAVNTMVKDFLEASGDSRAGVILYSSQPELSIDFGEYSSTEDVYNRVNALSHRRSHTRTDLALEFAARSLFASPRSNVPNIVIVFTDGIQTPGNGVASLDKAVQPLVQKGVRVFAVSVGSNVDMKELNAMVASPDDVFQVTSFSELVEKASKLSQATCPAPSPRVNSTPQSPASTAPQVISTERPTAAPIRPSCNKLLDIVFVMDSSRSIDRNEYNKEKDFVKELATIFKIGSGSRASVIIYSDDPELKIRFDQFNNVRDFSNAVDRLRFIMKRTRIDKALLMTSDVLKGARVGFPKAVIVLTDGIQSRDSDAMSLNKAAEYVHKQGARILVVGIGSKIVKDQLNLMVTSPSDVFAVDSFDSLVRAARNVAVRTCSTPVQNTVKPNTVVVPGSCPQYSAPIRCPSFNDKCLDDKYCSGGTKCCFDGCHYDCTIPVAPITSAPAIVPAVKPGACPSFSSGSSCRSFFDLCKNDRSCSKQDKCCYDGCRYTCMSTKPSSGHSTDAPTQLGPGLKCSELFDLGFAMDSSGSIREPNFNLEKEFVKDLAGQFTIGEVQLGLVLFSDAPLLFVRFGSASSTSLDGFRKAVDRLPFLRGRTRIDRALQSTADYLFPGGRDGVPKALVLFTDGRQSRDPDSLPTREAAKKLRDDNVPVFVVGVGPDVNREDLSVLVDDTSSDMFFVPSFQDLLALTSKIERAICSAMGKRQRTEQRRRS